MLTVKTQLETIHALADKDILGMDIVAMMSMNVKTAMCAALMQLALILKVHTTAAVFLDIEEMVTLAVI